MNRILLLLILTMTVHASELDLVKQFFSPHGISNKEFLYTGEMYRLYLDQTTLGEELPTNIEISYKKVEKNDTSAVYSVLLSQDSVGANYYIYLSNIENTWKLRALRSLALPPLYYMALEEFKKKENKSAEDSLDIKIMTLATSTDTEIKQFLIDHEAEFNELVKLAQKDFDAASKTTKKLCVNTLVNNGSGVLEFIISGMIDNSVGFLYVPDNATPPPITEDRYILIDEIVPNWYIFKTT